jgi:hypothetical protein
MDRMDTTGKALIDFWQWAGDKGVINQHTATAKRVACSQVLGVMDNWETLDVSALNIDDVFRRFTNKRSKEFTPASLGTYKSRFKQALSDFLAHSKNPELWKPSKQDRAASTTARKEKVSKNGNGTTPTSETTPHVDALPGRAGLVEYPFPLREGRFAYLRLPADLKAADVKRLTGFLNTLADDSA